MCFGVPELTPPHPRELKSGLPVSSPRNIGIGNHVGPRVQREFCLTFLVYQQIKKTHLWKHSPYLI